MNADKSKKASKNVTTETKKENQDTKKGEKNANKINNISNNINNNTTNKQYKEEGSNLRSKKKNDQFEKEKKVPPKKNFLDNFDGRYQKFVELVKKKMVFFQQINLLVKVVLLIKTLSVIQLKVFLIVN